MQETTELLRTSEQCQKTGRLKPGVFVIDSEFTFGAFPVRTRMPSSLQNKAMGSPGELPGILCDFREYLGLERRDEMREPLPY